jgi:hypothetical protein
MTFLNGGTTRGQPGIVPEATHLPPDGDQPGRGTRAWKDVSSSPQVLPNAREWAN